MSTTTLAATMQGFFPDRLARQRQVSNATIAACRYTIRLLLRFAADHNHTTPSLLTFDDLDAAMIGEFLDHLETTRHNSVATRNARLEAIHSF